MNVVKCYIDHSAIPNAGLGLFSSDKISKGQIVWENNPCSEIVYTKEEFYALPNGFRENIKKCVYKCKEKYHLNLDDSRHYNHSDDYNVTEDELGNYIAIRDIDSGEELLCNYMEFYDYDWVNEILPIT